MLREACLRGLSTRAVGRVVAPLTEESVSAQTVSRLTRDLDQAVAPVHPAPLADDCGTCFWKASVCESDAPADANGSSY